jgi:hypothetical protein
MDDKMRKYAVIGEFVPTFHKLPHTEVLSRGFKGNMIFCELDNDSHLSIKRILVGDGLTGNGIPFRKDVYEFPDDQAALLWFKLEYGG